MAEFRRSRLERKNNDQVTKKTVVFGVLTIVLAASLLIFGLPFLIKFSVFLGENKKTATASNKVLPPLAPRLVMPFEATNSATISISGFAEAKVTVELFKNESSIGKTEVTESGDFSFNNVDLDEGDNNFSAMASTEKTGSGEKSNPIDLVYDKTAPTLNLTNPSESSLSVDYADIDIIGNTDKGSSILINGRMAMVDNSGNFKLRWQLNTGKNDLEVIARDIAGNETKKTISITYSL
jgi:bacillopeptidase F